MSERPATVPVCYRHPSRETYVRCTRCDRSICPDCMRAAAVGHQCPECVAEGRRTQRPVRTAFGGGATGRYGHATKVLIAINLLVFVGSVLSAGRATAVAGSGMAGLMGSGTPLTDWGSVLGLALYPDGTIHGVADGEYYRLFTAMFLHYGVLHVAMNMYALWLLGRQLETALGPIRFVALYLLSGLAGNVAAYLFTAENTFSAGASTAIFGLFAAMFVLLRRLGRDTSAVVPILVLNLVITITVPNISIPGHLGGLVAGAIVAAVLAYAPQRGRDVVQSIGCGVVLVLLLAATAARTVALTG